jgi:indole-3-glycerol phosphate synthase
VTYLDRILVAHRDAAARDSRPLGPLVKRASDLSPTRGFRRALADSPASEIAVVAEVKRRSPSKGPLAPALDPAALARDYQSGGATCLSVLTDEEFFGGSAADLAQARAACELPVLRKDFTVSDRDVVDARLMGADAVLLIVAALAPDELEQYLGLADQVGLDALVEVHDEAELEQAVAAGAELIGVNQRDLVTFEVDTARAVRLGHLLPEEAIGVAESGIRDGADAAALREAGYRAVLVGETLVTSPDPAEAVRRLRTSRAP